MSCSSNNITSRRGNGFVLVVVLYILLAIMLGGKFNC